jgi:predicted Zn-ribbon and HTH transcriptional regulator
LEKNKAIPTRNTIIQSPWCHYCGYEPNMLPWSLRIDSCCYQCEVENVHVEAPKFVNSRQKRRPNGKT